VNPYTRQPEPSEVVQSHWKSLGRDHFNHRRRLLRGRVTQLSRKVIFLKGEIFSPVNGHKVSPPAAK
jgi:hypothetical protein